MTTDDDIDEDALSFGYVLVDQLHRVRECVTEEVHCLEFLPEGAGEGPEVRQGRPPWADVHTHDSSELRPMRTP
jgi:hypothetical protein